LGEGIVRPFMKISGFKCDVGSSHPGAEEGAKGRSVRPLK